MNNLTTRHLFHLSLKAGLPQPIGAAPTGTRRIVPVEGGTFAGDRLRGIVLPGGSDWITIRSDDAWHLDVRIVLQTDDDQRIAMTYQGLRHGPPEIMALVNRGEPVDPSTYYFRSVATFETASQRYGWMNGIFAVGKGYRPPEGPCYGVFEVT
ncbi:DUF3237 domain-containing protein [Bradyrhizobium sp. NP1]|uniref:DUF3237 domain-containing protein n=1 Tax=Bradyrhizobium sp. NP1 TaxID=3049772 RepID=UPI0025A4D40B|nr:DUF3237 domain-containing protein [Bradyrhizobium sp. NP1]WJR77437.1 DUF3237 domain-containing protein [Bradyrhizobium sp. NP1]